MSMLPEAFRQVMIDGDLAGLRALWSSHAPHLPAIADDREAEVVLHSARTAATSIPFALRGWSHRWLCERSLPSQLPNELRPRAERLEVIQVETVGICVGGVSRLGRAIAPHVQRAISLAVEELYADDPHPLDDLVRQRMDEVRDRAERQLLGVIRR